MTAYWFLGATSMSPIGLRQVLMATEEVSWGSSPDRASYALW